MSDLIFNLKDEIKRLTAEYKSLTEAHDRTVEGWQAVLLENEQLREFLERGGIDSSSVIGSEDDGTWRDENERLTARIAELEAELDLANTLWPQ